VKFSMQNLMLNGVEKTLFGLRSLFEKFGYSAYKMNKFEEYDLYVKNKDFLISENVITFTDTNGKLMALKPDVTLSIVKNTKYDGKLRKVYYDENVYRVSKGSNLFREIPQTGIECLGDIDDFCVSEVLSLAIKSLKSISDSVVLEISPFNIVFETLEKLNLSQEVLDKIYKCLTEKNAHELESVLKENAVSSECTEFLLGLVKLDGKVSEIFTFLKRASQKLNLKGVSEFENYLGGLTEAEKSVIKVDFSLCANLKYYNGIIFKGYVEGVPVAILSGGRYDNLMKRVGKNCGAIGFAIYLDAIDRLFADKKEYDVDVVVVYKDGVSVKKLTEFASELRAQGNSVTVIKNLPEKITYKKIIQFEE